MELGIPGPKPYFIYGNMEEVFKKGATRCHFEWIKKYGNVVGYFQGSKPILLVSNLDFMKNFMISNHMDASGRDWFIEDGGVPLKSFRKSAVGVVDGIYWKELRNIMSSSFTSRKLKGIIPILDKSVTRLLSKIEKKIENKELVSMKALFSEFAFDSTMLNIFGVEDNGHEIGRKFHEDVKQLSNVSFEDTIISLALCFPEFSTVFTLIREAKDKISYYLGRPSCMGAYKNLFSVLCLRKSNPQIQRNDILQLLMNAGDDNSKVNVKHDTQKRTLSTDEIITNLIDLAIGSYDTTISTLTFTLYMMVKHPEIQDKVRKELNSLNENEEEVRNSFLNGVPYLDQVIYETLRYYTIVRLLINRKVTGEIKWNSIILPKNLVIQVAAYQLHHDPEYWKDPESVNPDRFSPENKREINPITFQGFGYGSRNCVGMRFGLLVLRQTFTRLLSKYKFEACEKTKHVLWGTTCKTQWDDFP
ncbi:cytochrome P450 3A2-like isoform X2 [Centruroides sculpturatus]|uniref:cytochrome P450 3A2-like isoform X2 n=1 Tax=Centruroides sculpturatus TaxID=218467 RepID=UPI000C6DA440|nr:cytochrome P450 3A2-like isoform X2 [Centruroides sculpturatus]